MKHKLIISLLLAGCSFFSSCHYDNFKELYPESALSETPCDSAGVISYSLQIVPILSENCTQSCHNPNASPGNGNRDLTNYAQVNDAAVNGGVTAGDGGPLYGTVNWDPNYGNDMPKGSATKISACDITKIKKWAMAGAPNN